MIARKNNRPLIAAHRGVAAGNIPCNTLAAFDAALRQGADIIELDITRSQDGKLFVFHPGKERMHLYCATPIKKMAAAEVEKLHFVNVDSDATQFTVSYFDDVLEHLRGRCQINVDKFYMYMPEITQTIRRHGMQEDVIVKTPEGEDWYRQVEEIAPDLPYMIMTHNDNFSEQLMKRPMRYLGAEVLFTDDRDRLASPEYVEWMHKNNLLIWANAIVYDYRTVLSGGHNDDISVVGREDEGWGWLADRGYDIIQTDWTLAMRLYLENRKA